ncbi:MAG TPA: DnaJ C-terminal domain-containing protein [Candidatus Binatia bacterium]|nr:DnaJ C-terminal domain-containing protein [Candidatus Binatia bacterium]
MNFKDYYKTLGVARSADDKAIKSAYRRLARKHHPDVSKGSPDTFKEINEAYEVLSDPEKRKRYDTLGPDWERHVRPGPGPEGAPFSNFEVRFGASEPSRFSDFFRSVFGDLGGGRARAPGRARGIDVEDLGFSGVGEAGVRQRGQNVEVAIEVTLDDAFAGASKTVSLAMDEPCPVCGGSGHENRKPCSRCRGTGWTKGHRHLEVRIPAGVDTGSRVRVIGEGPGGLSGGARGDLYLRVTVTPHPDFTRKGDDLYVDLPVSAADAALGAELAVPTLRGQVSMKIPAESSSGRTFRLPGYGMPHLKGSGAGDEYVRVQVTIPNGLTPRERALFEDLRAQRPVRAARRDEATKETRQ